MSRSFCKSRPGGILVKILVFWLIGAAVCVAQQTPTAQSAAVSPNSQKIYVVLPFENAGAPARLDWLGEGLEELTIQRLTAAGEQVYSHSGRANELERYGLPSSSTFSRATMLRVAEDLDADYVIYGKYAAPAKGTPVTIEVR